MTTNLNEALTTLAKAVVGTGIDVNVDEDVVIHWHGVITLECSPAVAAKAIAMFKQLELFGARSC